MSISDSLKQFLYDKGASIVGYGDLSQISAASAMGMPYGVSIAVKMTPSVIRGITELPTREYYEEYGKLNNLLDSIVSQGAEYLISEGYNAIAQSRKSLENRKDYFNTPVPHKTVATRSGLGWIGKCAVLVTDAFGSALRLSSILTDAPLEANNPVNESKCGGCNICTQACLAGAVKGVNWRLGMNINEYYSQTTCKKRTGEVMMETLGINEHLCGKCIAVCPYTQRYIRNENMG